MMESVQAFWSRKPYFLSSILLIIFLTSCATTNQLPLPLSKPSTKPSSPVTQPKQAPRPAGPLPPSTRPTYNLSGFPPATKEGYIDGCETAKKTRWGYKDDVRYSNDLQYRMGWDDGNTICGNQKAK
ncbi:MAG: hypothetical protein U1E82_11210 [Nitrosomonas sp.]|nr:hypothetical protein [Nitrosomonas sp.]